MHLFVHVKEATQTGFETDFFPAPCNGEMVLYEISDRLTKFDLAISSRAHVTP